MRSSLFLVVGLILAISSPTWTGSVSVKAQAQLPVWSADRLGQGATFSRDGSLLAVGAQPSEFVVVRTSSGDLVRRFRHETNSALNFGFSDDGTRVVSSSQLDASTIVWELSTGRVISRHKGLSGKEQSSYQFNSVCALSANGEWMAMARNRRLDESEPATIEIWSVFSGRKMCVIRESGQSISLLSFSSSGRLLFTDPGLGSSKVWAIPDGRLVVDLRDRYSGATTVMFAADESLLVGPARGAAVEMTDLKSGVVTRIPSPESYSAFAVRADGGVVAFARKDGIDIVDVSTRSIVGSIGAGPAVSSIRTLRFGPGGRLVSHGASGLAMWSLVN